MEQRYIAGDLVRYIGVSSPIVVQITEVREDKLLIDFGECNWYLADYSEVEPIPLTVEALTCNGWIWSDEHEEFAKHGVVIYPVDNYYRPDIFNMKIRYVHELQHLLFGLGLDNYMKMPKNYILPKGSEEWPEKS